MFSGILSEGINNDNNDAPLTHIVVSHAPALLTELPRVFKQIIREIQLYNGGGVTYLYTTTLKTLRYATGERGRPWNISIMS